MGAVGVARPDQLDTGHTREPADVAVQKRLALRQGRRVFVHGRQPERGGEVGHLVLVADLGDVVLPDPELLRRSVDAEPAQPLGLLHQPRVAQHQHAAVAGGHQLDGLEREHREIGQPAHRASFVGGPERVRGVLDEDEPVLPGDGVQFVEVARQPAVVDAHDRLGPRRDERPHMRRIHVQRARLDVGEHRLHPHVEERDVRGRAGEDGRDDLVAGDQAGQQVGEVQGIGAGADGERGLVRSDQRGEPSLELGHPRSLADPAGSEHLLDGLSRTRRDVRVEQDDVAVARFQHRELVHGSMLGHWARRIFDIETRAY